LWQSQSQLLHSAIRSLGIINQGARMTPNQGATKNCKVNVEGELKVKEDSSSKPDSVNGFVFKVSKAVTEDGHEMTELRDQIVSLLDNPKSKPPPFALNLPARGAGSFRAGSLALSMELHSMALCPSCLRRRNFLVDG
jgi:hypothetical protein